MPKLPVTYLVEDRDGILWYRDPDLDRSIWVRMREAGDGRWEVAELYVPPDERPVSPDDLRRIPLGRIEAYCNDPDTARKLQGGMTDDPIGLEEFSRQAGVRAAGQSQKLKSRRGLKPRPLVLDIPAGRPYPVEFFEAVAALYSELAVNISGPSVAIATANNVPVTTVSRWIKECRRRGLLAPGRSGKAG